MHYEQHSAQASANLAAIDSGLTELDHIFLRFCSEHNYKFSRNLQIWPKSRVWCRQEIDRCMDLVMDIGFQQALDVGFFPEMPWSLYAQGSLHPGTDPEVHLLTRPIFEHVPFSQLASVLEAGLTSGMQILDSMTEAEVLSHGQTAREIQDQGQAEYDAYVRAQRSARTAEPGASPNGGPADPFEDPKTGGGPPSVS